MTTKKLLKKLKLWVALHPFFLEDYYSNTMTCEALCKHVRGCCYIDSVTGQVKYKLQKPIPRQIKNNNPIYKNFSCIRWLE